MNSRIFSSPLLILVSCLALLLVLAITPTLHAAKSDKKALKAFKGPYAGGWTRDGVSLPLNLTLPKSGKGRGRGTFEATPCDSDDGLSPLAVKVTKVKLLRNGKKAKFTGKATWERSKVPQLGGPNPTGPLKLVAVLRGKKPSAKGRITAGSLAGPVNAKKGGALPTVPAPWMEMVFVGNPGNGTDAGNESEASVYGNVDEDFKIGKYEVTNAQYAEFLNAVAKTELPNPHELYATEMDSDSRGGITRTGADGSYVYTAKAGRENMPVVFVNFWDACRFCNWLHNGKPTGLAGALTTETGAYNLTGFAATDAKFIQRSAGAKYFLPSEDQWYKAAYHDPRSAGSDGPPGDDNYWKYPTKNDDDPAGEDPPGGANSANFLRSNLTEVGAYTGSASFYGTYDQGGNVWEWNEAKPSDPSNRGLRGGSWLFLEDDLQSSFRSNDDPDDESSNDGFRISSP